MKRSTLIYAILLAIVIGVGFHFGTRAIDSIRSAHEAHNNRIERLTTSP